MAIHHIALATADTAATHAFYTGAMGFRLAKVEVAPAPEGGWAKHLFYDTGEGMLAFWELHGDFPPVHGGMSSAVGLPLWVNHLAFRAVDGADLEARRDRWLDHGHDVMEIDHRWCRSVYTVDPNQTLVEWCCDTRVLTDADAREAERLLADPEPVLGTPPVPVFHRATT